jgi:hypothetical protein
MAAIKAIETHYKGYRFRSRLEARWAVFLDAMHVKWYYEHEGYELSSGWYLPDFWLPELGLHIEVKPDGNCIHADSFLNTVGAILVTNGMPDEVCFLHCFDTTDSGTGGPNKFAVALGSGKDRRLALFTGLSSGRHYFTKQWERCAYIHNGRPKRGSLIELAFSSSKIARFSR